MLFANPADPWWNTNWHYRAELNIANAVINQTGKLNIDFAALGLPSALDVNSIRIVKSDGITLLSKQEYTDTVYNNITDAANNNRGEVKFIIEDSGNIRYYIYYDTVANGPKGVLGATYVINGNFEHSSGSIPTGWVTGQLNIGINQPNNEVHPIAGEGNTVNITDANYGAAVVNNSAHTGTKFHLHGYRDRQESSNVAEQVWIEKTLSVPVSNPGTLTFWFRVQGWDQTVSNNSYDRVQVRVNGVIVNPQTLTINNPNLNIFTQVYGKRSIYTQYGDAGWTQATLNLNGYAGNTITVRINFLFAGDNISRTWQLIDDMEWSIQNVAIGIQETLPNMSITKQSCVISDPVNLTNNPKRIPGATIRYAFQVSNSGTVNANNVIVDDILNSNFNYTTIRNLQILNGACNCLGVTSNSNNPPPGTGNGVHPIKLNFGTVSGGSVATPTQKCGYFEVDIK
jgi:uncharacterized repeat protein (TIGR01451 family)